MACLAKYRCKSYAFALQEHCNHPAKALQSESDNGATRKRLPVCRNSSSVKRKKHYCHFFQKKQLFDVRFLTFIRFLSVTVMERTEFNNTVIPMRNELKVYALRLTGNDNDAEDIVQEVLLKL